MQHRAADNRPAGEKRNLVIIRPKGELGKSLLRDPKPKPSQLELPKIVHRSTDQRKSLLKPVEPSQDFKTCSIDDQRDNLEELRAAITKLEYQIDQIEDQLSGKRLVNIGMAKNIEKLIVEGSKVQRDLENTIHDNENTRSEISTKNGVVEANKRKLELKKQELEAVENSNREARQVSLRADQMESEMHTYRRTIQSQIMMSNAIMPLLLSASRGEGEENQGAQQGQSMIERHNEALQGMDFSEDFEDDFIPLDQFERIEKYRWNPTDPDEERRRCTICYYNFVEQEKVRRLSCGHTFHSRCIKTWTRRNKCCPFCDREIVIPN